MFLWAAGLYHVPVHELAERVLGDIRQQELLRAPKAVANSASRRISEKSGMRLVAREEHEYVYGRLPAEIWEITAEEWNARGT